MIWKPQPRITNRPLRQPEAVEVPIPYSLPVKVIFPAKVTRRYIIEEKGVEVASVVEFEGPGHLELEVFEGVAPGTVLDADGKPVRP